MKLALPKYVLSQQAAEFFTFKNKYSLALEIFDTPFLLFML